MINNEYEVKLLNSFLETEINKSIIEELKVKKTEEIYQIKEIFEEQVKEGLMTNEIKNSNAEDLINNNLIKIDKCTNTINNMIKSYINLEYIQKNIDISSKMKNQIIFTYENPDLEGIIEDSPYNTNKEIQQKKHIAFKRAYSILSYESGEITDKYTPFDLNKEYDLKSLKNEINKCPQIKYWPILYKCIKLFTEKRIDLTFLQKYNT